MKKIIVDERLAEFVAREEGPLGRLEHQVVRGATGREILEIHRREHADLIVTSLEPPGMTGEALCAALRGDEGARRVSIIVVGEGLPEERGRLRACRANHYFEPPVDHAEFSVTIRQLISVAARQKYGVLVSVDVEGSVKGVPFFAKTANLSISGIMIITARLLRVGERVNLAFFIPGYGRLTLESEVVRVEPRDGRESGYGARFINVSSPMRTAIASFVGSRLGGHRPEGSAG